MEDSPLCQFDASNHTSEQYANRHYRHYFSQNCSTLSFSDAWCNVKILSNSNLIGSFRGAKDRAALSWNRAANKSSRIPLAPITQKNKNLQFTDNTPHEFERWMDLGYRGEWDRYLCWLPWQRRLIRQNPYKVCLPGVTLNMRGESIHKLLERSTSSFAAKGCEYDIPGSNLLSKTLKTLIL